jgi:hypothetical protein
VSDETLLTWTLRQLPVRPSGPAEEVKRAAWSTVLRIPVPGGVDATYR